MKLTAVLTRNPYQFTASFPALAGIMGKGFSPEEAVRNLKTEVDIALKSNVLRVLEDTFVRVENLEVEHPITRRINLLQVQRTDTGLLSQDDFLVPLLVVILNRLGGSADILDGILWSESTSANTTC